MYRLQQTSQLQCGSTAQGSVCMTGWQAANTGWRCAIHLVMWSGGNGKCCTFYEILFFLKYHLSLVWVNRWESKSDMNGAHTNWYLILSRLPLLNVVLLIWCQILWRHNATIHVQITVIFHSEYRHCALQDSWSVRLIRGLEPCHATWWLLWWLPAVL